MVKTRKRRKKSSKDVGQITVKKIGKKYVICISGTPERIENMIEKAEKFADKLREKHGKRLKHIF